MCNQRPRLMVFNNMACLESNHNFVNGRTGLPIFAGAMALAFALFGVTENASAAKGEARVLVDAFAQNDYIKEKEGDDGARLETYHLMEGKRFGGLLKDKSIGEVPFMEVAKGLAVQMKKRNFYPARSPKEGDFMIVVHRGVTRIEADWDELFPADDSEDEAALGGEEEEGDELTDPEDYLREEGYTYTEGQNAAMIGFDRALQRPGLMVQEEMELQEMLREERYFLVLLAYDWQKLRTTGEKDLVWSTRFSMDAVRVNFDDAHLALSRAASNYFGTNLDGKLGKVKTFVGPGEVTTGDLEVVETVQEENE